MPKLKISHITISLIVFLIFEILFFNKCTQASPAIPQKMNYQGKLLDSMGNPLSGDFAMVFSIWDAESGGTQKWLEKRDGTPNPKVTVTNGLFNVELGAYNAINLDFTQPYWLQIMVEGELLTPRQSIVSSGYTYNAVRVKDDPTYFVEPTATPDSASLAGNLKLEATGISPEKGIIKVGNTRFIHNYPEAKNIFIGLNAGNLTSQPGDGQNVGIGTNVLQNVYTTFWNTAVGSETLKNLSEGAGYNVALGFRALQNLETGSGNVAIGGDAGINLKGNSSGNIIIGPKAGPATERVMSDRLYIHNDTTDEPLIYGDFRSESKQVKINGKFITTDNTDIQGILKVNGDFVAQANAYVQSDLTVYGNLNVSGSKNFKINHPTKPGYKLVHACIEGPEAAVFYRGQAKLKNGQTEIVLPDYFEALTRKDSRTVQLTAKGKRPFTLSATEIVDGKFKVYGTKANGEFFWEVKAVRQDIEPLKVEVKD